MDFAFTEVEEALQQEVRDWLKEEIPPRWHEIYPITNNMGRPGASALGTVGADAPTVPRFSDRASGSPFSGQA